MLLGGKGEMLPFIGELEMTAAGLIKCMDGRMIDTGVDDEETELSVARALESYEVVKCMEIGEVVRPCVIDREDEVP